LSEPNIKRAKLIKWDTFDQFKEEAFCQWFVTSPKESLSRKSEIQPVLHFPKSGCANMLLVLESSPNLINPQLHPKNKLMSQKSGRSSKARLGL